MSDNDSLAIPPPTISGGAPKSLLFKNPKTSPLFQASSSSGSNAPAGDPAPSGIQGFKFAPTLKRPSQQQQQQSSSIPSVVGQGSSSVALSIFGKPHFRSPKTNIFQAQLDPNAIESSNTSSTANDGGARSSEPSTGKSTLSFGFEPFPKPTVSTVIESASTSLASSGRPRSSSKPEAHSPAKRLFSNKKSALPTVDNTSPGQFVQQQPPPHSVAPEILQDSVPTPFLVAPSDDQAPGVLLPGMSQDPNHAAQEPEKSTQFSRPLSRSHLYAFKSLPDVSTSTPPSKTGLPLDLPTLPASAIPISSRYFISHQVPPSPVDTPPRTPSATRRQAMTPFPPPPSRIPIPQHSTTEEDVEDVIRGAVSKYKTQLKHKDETIKSMATDRDELNNTICKKQAALEVFQERIQVMNSMLQRQAMKWEQNRKRIEGMKDRYDLYQSTLRHVDIAISDLQTDKERMFADLELSRGDHVALAAKYEAMVKEYHEGIAQKQSEITRLTSTQEELREYLQEARFKIKNLSKDVEEHGGNLARTTVERDQLRSELAQATSTHADLAQTHAVLLAGHVREVEQLKASIDVLDQACKRHQDETKQRDDRITAMASELAFLGGRLEVANADATRVKAQVTDLQEQGRTLNAVLEQSTKAVESERLAHEAIVQKLKEADHEKAEARRVSETNLRKELEEVNSRVLDLVARGNEIESTLERERERHTVEVAELRNFIESLEEQLHHFNERGQNAMHVGVSTRDEPSVDLLATWRETSDELARLRIANEQNYLASEEMKRRYERELSVLQSQVGLSNQDSAAKLEAATARIAELQSKLEVTSEKLDRTMSAARAAESKAELRTSEIESLNIKTVALDASVHSLSQEREDFREQLAAAVTAHQDEMAKALQRFEEIRRRDQVETQNQLQKRAHQIKVLEETALIRAQESQILRSALEKTHRDLEVVRSFSPREGAKQQPYSIGKAAKQQPHSEEVGRGFSSREGAKQQPHGVEVVRSASPHGGAEQQPHAAEVVCGVSPREGAKQQPHPPEVVRGVSPREGAKQQPHPPPPSPGTASSSPSQFIGVPPPAMACEGSLVLPALAPLSEIRSPPILDINVGAGAAGSCWSAFVDNAVDNAVLNLTTELPSVGAATASLGVPAPALTKFADDQFELPASADLAVPAVGGGVKRKKNNPHDNNTASSGGKHPTKKPSAVTSASSTSSPAAGRALPPNPGSLSPSGDSSVAPPPSASRPRTRGRRLELIFDDVTHNDMSSDQPPPSRPKTYIPARTYSKKGGRSSKR